MTIETRMTKAPVTATPDMPIQAASDLMKGKGVKCLPVLDKAGKLVGIISEKDILTATPSPASTLSVYEMNFLLSSLTVKKIMSRNPVTVTIGTSIEDAAMLMIDQHINYLPVMEGDELVGIASKTDLLKMFIETIGARVPGTTINFVVPDKHGTLAAVTNKMTENGLNLISCSVFNSTETNNKIITLKVASSNRNQLVDIVKPLALKILDIETN